LLHNQLIPQSKRNEFLRQWFGLEEWLNEHKCIDGNARTLFMGVYVHAHKPTLPWMRIARSLL